MKKILKYFLNKEYKTTPKYNINIVILKNFLYNFILLYFFLFNKNCARIFSKNSYNLKNNNNKFIIGCSEITENFKRLNSSSKPYFSDLKKKVDFVDLGNIGTINNNLVL